MISEHGYFAVLQTYWKGPESSEMKHHNMYVDTYTCKLQLNIHTYKHISVHVYLHEILGNGDDIPLPEKLG